MNSSQTLDASVIVCTYNRADSLRQTLQCLAQQTTAADLRWEIIVVDNNSKDDTRAVVEAAKATMPHLRYEFEGKQGLSNARNHGIACAHGALLLFTDDDVCPEPDWVSKVVAGMEAHQAQACGGYIAPVWETPPPAWLTERFYGFIAVRTEQGQARPITSVKDVPFGANMAFRRSVFEQLGGFDTSRGRSGKTLASGEDTEMFERILAAGSKVVYLPETRVHHKVEAFRTNKRYFRRWRYQNSRNFAQACGVAGSKRVGNVPLYLFGQLLQAALRTALAYLSKPADEAFFREIIVWHLLGLMAGSRKAKTESAHAGA